MRPILLLLALALLAPAALAQSQTEDCGCNAALAKDLSSIIRSDKQQYAFLNMIDQQTFEEYKKDSSFLASIPIAKAIVEASANFSDFQQRRTSYFQQVQYSATREQEYQELQIVTSPVAYKYWGECMQSCARNRTGLFAWKEREDKDAVVLVVYYHGAPGSKSVKLGGSYKVGGSPSRVLFPAGTLILNNGSVAKIIDRTGGRTVTSTVSAAGFTDTMYSEWNAAVNNNSATLKLERPGVVETPAGPWCQVSGWTGANSNKGCEGAPCSPDGKWQATVMPVTLTAPPGHVLRNPRFTRCWRWQFGFGTGLKEVEGGDACDGWWGVDAINVGPGETSITALFKAWSNPTKREFCADLIRRDTQVERKDVAVSMPAEGSFTFEVPGGFTSAVLDYRVNGANGLLQVGQPASADNHLKLIAKVPTLPGGTTYYQYLIQ